MLNSSNSPSVYLACGSTDLRKSIDGLAVLVKEVFQLDPFSSALFVFCNRKQDKIKILHWDHSGFWLYYKRLEKGRFQWPNGQSARPVTYRQFRWLLDGLPLEQGQAHRPVLQRTIL